MSGEQQVALGGGRVFVLHDRDIGGFLWGCRGKLVPGEMLVAVCERIVMPGRGLGLGVRVVLDTPQGQNEVLSQFFIPDFKEGQFPWGLFLTPLTLPVVFLADDATPSDVLCVTVHHEERERQDLDTQQVREYDVYHTLFHVPPEQQEKQEGAVK